MLIVIPPNPPPPLPAPEPRRERGTTASGPDSPIRAMVGLETMPPLARWRRLAAPPTAPPTALPKPDAAPPIAFTAFKMGAKTPVAQLVKVLIVVFRKSSADVRELLIPSQMPIKKLD